MTTESNELAIAATQNALTPAEEIREYRRGSAADNTLKAYGRAFGNFRNWLDGREVTDESLCSYLILQDKQGLAPATIAMTLKAVKWSFAKMDIGASFPKAHDVLKRINREGKERGRGQVEGLEWNHVEKICAKAEESGTLSGLRDSAMIRLMSDCLLRISEVIAVNAEDISENTLDVLASKSDQTGKGTTLYIGDDTKESIEEYRRAAGIERGALFRRIRRGGHVTEGRITVVGARNAIKNRAHIARSTKTMRVSGHSMRVGSAVSLARAGATVVDMQTAGRWQDPKMPAHYARAELAERGAIARFKYGK